MATVYQAGEKISVRRVEAGMIIDIPETITHSALRLEVYGVADGPHDLVELVDYHGTPYQLESHVKVTVRGYFNP